MREGTRPELRRGPIPEVSSVSPWCFRKAVAIGRVRSALGFSGISKWKSVLERTHPMFGLSELRGPAENKRRPHVDLCANSLLLGDLAYCARVSEFRRRDARQPCS